MGRPREFDETDALSAAMDVFWIRGYTNASMQELCDAMGLNPGSVYAAYGSKRQLFHVAVQHYLSLVTQEGISKLTQASSGIKGVQDYFDYIIDGIVNGRRCNGCFGTNSFIELSRKDEAMKKVIIDHFALLEAAFRQALERDGRIDAAAHARHLVCIAQGLNVLAHTSPSRTNLEQIVKTALAALVTEKVAQ